jgi:parvulin-like peptidyl-prolyl isomerase
MQRHVANGGNPYDHFGHYVISLSEQAYNYRRVNNLLARKSFTENSEVFEITEKSKKKIKDIKKVLERIQRQNGYLIVRENFTTFKKKEMDEETLNELRSAFTTQQFNEELVELFPYISDLIGEEREEEEELDELSPATLSSFIRKKEKQPGGYKKTGLAADKIKGRGPDHPYARGGGAKVFATGVEKDPVTMGGKNNWDLIKEPGADTAKERKAKRFSAYRDEEKKDREAGYNVSEAEMSDDEFNAKHAPSADWVAQDAKAKAFPTRGDSAQRQGGLLDNLEQAVQAAPFIEIEPYSKEFITKAIAITQNQVDQLTQKAQENPRDNQTKWGLEKATARLGILMKRLETAEAQGPEKNSIAIEHLGKHIKNNDVISNLMLSASDEYNRMAPAEKQRMVKIYKEIVSKQKYVGLFTNESIAYTDLEITLSETKKRDNRFIEGLDPVVEFIKGLRKAIGEESEEEEDDDCDCQTDEEDMVKPRPDKAEKTGDPKDVVEFVKSLYNADENSFPRGEEGVVISSVKEFGDEAEPIARKVIEALKAEGAANGAANPNDDMMRMKQLAGLAPVQNF